MPGLEDLNRSIERFEKASADLREACREAHEATKSAIQIRKELERASQNAVERFDKMIEDYVAKELEQIGEKATEASNHIYDKVGQQIDILINTALGKHMSRRGRTEDLRPALAKKLREWIQEELDKTV